MRIFFIATFTIFLSLNCTGYFAFRATKPIKNSEMHSIKTEDLTQYYYTLGNKNDPPLVFIHGILAFTQAYRDIINELSDRYYIIGIDLRGHGRSTVGDESFSFYQIAEDIINVTNAIGIQEFYAVGHSAGGFVLLSIGKYFPGKIIKGVSIASLYHYDGINFKKNGHDYLTENGFMDNLFGRNSLTLDYFDRAHKSMGEEEKFNQTKQLMMEYGTQLYPSFTHSDLSSINDPILIIVAEKDKRIKPSHTEEMSKYLPNSELVLIPDATHFSIVRSKKYLGDVTEHIFQFLD